MLIQSGVIDQYVYFTGPPGMSTFTVYGARNGAAAAAFTTPTVAEVDGTNMPGLYELLLDEQTTMAAGNSTEILALHIEATGWNGTIEFVTLFDNLPADVVKVAGSTDIVAGGTGGQLYGTT